MGCASAYQIINNLGLEKFYQKRLFNQDIKTLKPEENNQININEFCYQEDGGYYEVDLLIEGLHCAACVWLIENVLKKQPEVQKARINMINRKLHLQWEGNKNIGNELVKMIFNLGYRLIPFDAESLSAIEKKYDNQILKALSVAGFSAGNVMLISVALWANSSLQMGVATRNMLYWVSALIALPAIIYSGRIFVISAFKSIKSGRMNMDVPIMVAIILVSIVSIFETITKGEHAYFDSLIMLIFFLLIGRFLDFSARKKAFSITKDLMMLSGTSATIITDDNQHKIIASKNLQKDMVLNVAMGEKIAADGIIIKGESEIDTAIITGESMPKKMVVNDEVFAGMVNLGDSLQVRINKAKEETLLAKIVQMVEKIENNKSYYTKISDIVAKYYTPIIHLIAFLTFLLWIFLGIGWHNSLLNAVAVLIVTCPCALALSIPVVQIVAAGKLLKQGILFKNKKSLKKINKVDTIIFDKTGTLTIGKPQLITAKIDDKIIQIATSMAVKSRHILSQALINNFKGKLLNFKVKEIAGKGLVANYNNEEIRLGSYKFCQDGFSELRVKKEFKPINRQDYLNPKIINDTLLQIYFYYQGQIYIFNFQDQIRKDAKKIIQELNHKYDIIILSGDKKSNVQSVAKQLRISQYYFERTPDQKLEVLQDLKGKGKNILMIGDGINDSPALTLADVSMSPTLACDINKNIADVIFQGEKLYPVLEVINIAKKSNKIIKQNLSFALLYNLITIPFAMSGYIVPLFAALVMSCSSIIVVLNALRMKK